MELAVQSTYSILRHCGADRIGVEVPYVPEIVQIPLRQWSRSHRRFSFHPHPLEEIVTSNIPIAKFLAKQISKSLRYTSIYSTNSPAKYKAHWRDWDYEGQTYKCR